MIKKTKWPFLEKMLDAKCLGCVDLALAQKLVGTYPEPIGAFLCHLSLAMRQGHLCVCIQEDNIYPPPDALWLNEEELPIPLEDLNLLKVLIQQGVASLAPPLLNLPCNKNSHPTAPIQKHNSNYYFHRYWHLERDILNGLASIRKHKRPALAVNFDMLYSRIEELIAQKQLLLEQGMAIMNACFNTLTLITGGPGTGKTYTAGILLRLLCEALPESQRMRCQIALAAPTGKAAANLESSIQKAYRTENTLPLPPAQTLHQLLGIKKYAHNTQQTLLTADIVIVDESSMIDAFLMSRLLHAIKPGARLILLGDRFQLPSVESGAIFADMASIPLAPTGEFITCLRTESQAIIDLAEAIKMGHTEKSLRLFEKGHDASSIQGIPLPESLTNKQLQQWVLTHVVKHFPVMTTIPHDLSQLLAEFTHYRLLTPMRQGPLGVDKLNEAILQAMQAMTTHAPYQVIPIMIAHNDYRMQLFNGEVGLLIKGKNGDKSLDYAVFTSRQSNTGIRKIPALMLPRYELAYCLSVHKSQGSEFDHVVLLLPEGSEVFGRAALYTGATRAKKHLEIISRPSIVKGMLERQSFRRSGLQTAE